MRTDPAQFDSCSPPARRTVALAAVVIAGVFYYLNHNAEISKVEHYAPWAVTTSTFATENTELRGLVYGIVVLLGAWLALRSPERPKPAGVLPLIVFAFIAWCFLSIAWSDHVRVTAIRLAVLLITCVGAFAVSRGLSLEGWMELVTIVAAAFLLIGIAAELKLGTFRPWDDGYRFAGTLHPNAQGGNLAMLSLAAYCRSRWGSRRGRCILLLLLALSLLILTKSRTACAALLASIALLEWTAAAPPTRFAMAMGLACCVSIAAFAIGLSGVDLQDEATQVVLMGRGDQLDDLSGRQPVWDALIPYMNARLWTGYGYETFWTQEHIEPIQTAVRWQVRDAHSAYLNTILGTGLVGAILFVGMLLCALIAATRRFRASGKPADALLLGLAAQFVAAGVLESNASPPGLEIFLLCVGIAALAFPKLEFATRPHSSPPLDAPPVSRERRFRWADG